MKREFTNGTIWWGTSFLRHLMNIRRTTIAQSNPTSQQTDGESVYRNIYVPSWMATGLPGTSLYIQNIIEASSRIRTLLWRKTSNPILTLEPPIYPMMNTNYSLKPGNISTINQSWNDNPCLWNINISRSDPPTYHCPQSSSRWGCH